MKDLRRDMTGEPQPPARSPPPAAGAEEGDEDKEQGAPTGAHEGFRHGGSVTELPGGLERRVTLLVLSLG